MLLHKKLIGSASVLIFSLVILAVFFSDFINTSASSLVYPWRYTTTMQKKKGWGDDLQGIAQSDGFVYASCGENDSTAEWAQINIDGTIDDWQSIDSIPACNILIYGDYIYAFQNSGYDPIYYSRISPGGLLNGWEMTTRMPDYYRYLVAGDGHIYTFTLADPEGTDQSINVKYADINPDGTIGNWQPTTGSTFVRYHMRNVIFARGYLYATGGGSSPQNPNWIERALVNADGSLGEWQNTTAWNLQRNQGWAFITDGEYLYVIGGYTADGPCDVVERGLINPDGSITVWDSVAPLLNKRANVEALFHNNLLYVFGGYDGKDYLSSVEYSDKDDLLPVPSGYGVSINGGSGYASSNRVLLHIGAKVGVDKMQISDNGGFIGSAWEPYTPYREWVFKSSRSNLRFIYVRFKDQYGNLTPSFQDNILLDPSAPKGSIRVISKSSMSGKVILKLSAKDKASGVSSMRLSDNRTFDNANWDNFVNQLEWTKTGKVYVQYKDKAGNLSRVYSASIPLRPPKKLNTPWNESTVENLMPTLSWIDSTAPVDGYEVQISLVGKKSVAKYRVSGTTFTFSEPLISGAKYKWHVRSIANGKYSKFSSYWYFNTP